MLRIIAVSAPVVCSNVAWSDGFLAADDSTALLHLALGQINQSGVSTGVAGDRHSSEIIITRGGRGTLRIFLTNRIMTKENNKVNRLARELWLFDHIHGLDHLRDIGVAGKVKQNAKIHDEESYSISLNMGIDLVPSTLVPSERPLPSWTLPVSTSRRSTFIS